MENAAQALLIAGMILLAMLTVTFLVYMSHNLETIGTAQALEKERERLASWNAEWEAFNKQVLYGAEVMTVINKAEKNNIENAEKTENLVTVTVKDNRGRTISNIVDYKKSIFKCTKMEYSNGTGRIRKIEFILVEDLR